MDEWPVEMMDRIYADFGYGDPHRMAGGRGEEEASQSCAVDAIGEADSTGADGFVWRNEMTWYGSAVVGVLLAVLFKQLFESLSLRAETIRLHDAHEQLVWELAERDATIARLMNTIDELREELSEADESLPFNQLESLHRVE